MSERASLLGLGIIMTIVGVVGLLNAGRVAKILRDISRFTYGRDTSAPSDTRWMRFAFSGFTAWGVAAILYATLAL